MENLMESSGAQRHQVAFELIHRGSSTTWNDSMRPFRDATARPDNANAQTLMGSLAASIDPVYHLVVANNGRIQLLYGLRNCFAAPGGGARVFALMGERIKVGDVVGEPELHSLGGNVGQQRDHFTRVEIGAISMADIAAAFTADDQLEVVQPDADPNAASGFGLESVRDPGQVCVDLCCRHGNSRGCRLVAPHCCSHSPCAQRRAHADGELHPCGGHGGSAGAVFPGDDLEPGGPLHARSSDCGTCSCCTS